MARFPRPVRGASRNLRATIFEPTRGFDGALPFDKLSPGFSPELDNWVVKAGFLEPRQGLSAFSDGAAGTPVLGGIEVFSDLGVPHATAFSDNTVAVFRSDSPGWSALSYAQPSTSSDDPPSASTDQYWSSAYIYAQTIDKNIAVATNNTNVPKFFLVDNSATTYSDFTFAYSLFSQCAAVAAVNDRLLAFNFTTGGSRRPTGVVWSSRGNPLDFTIAGGAGAELLVDMKGQGKRIIPIPIGSRDAYLFSDLEIWRARGRDDEFGFDFEPVNRDIAAPYPNAIASTPLGVVFLGRDFDLYLLDVGGNLIPIARTQGGHSRIRAYLRQNLRNPARAWVTYNRTEGRVELYYTSATSPNDFPDRALYFHLDTRAITHHSFPETLTWGYEFGAASDNAAPLTENTWNQITDTWDSITSTWDSFVDPIVETPPVDKSILVFSEDDGDTFQFASDQTSDFGNMIKAVWRSHGLNSPDPFRFDQLSLIEVEYASDSAGSLGIRVSSDGGTTWGSRLTKSTEATELGILRYPFNVRGRSLAFEVSSNDGSKPRLARFQAALREGARR